MIELKGVSKKYGITKAVEDVSFTLPQGQIVGLFGENGAGKTTLMKCILGLLPHQGSVTLDGAPHRKEHRAAQLRHLRALLLSGAVAESPPGLLSGPFSPVQ